MACHALDSGHAIDFSNGKIIRKGFCRTEERLMAEAIELAKSGTALNRNEGIVVSSIWRAAITRDGLSRYTSGQAPNPRVRRTLERDDRKR